MTSHRLDPFARVAIEYDLFFAGVTPAARARVTEAMARRAVPLFTCQRLIDSMALQEDRVDELVAAIEALPPKVNSSPVLRREDPY